MKWDYTDPYAVLLHIYIMVGIEPPVSAIWYRIIYVCTRDTYIAYHVVIFVFCLYQP